MDLAECVERLLRGFITYDRAVDVVSAFQMAFTTSHSEVPGTVRHFERFPRIPGDEDSTLTPDFTVVFEDGTGLAGEIARLARHENSAENLCRQVEKYDALRQLPDGAGLAEVTHTDVLLLVPQSVGVAAVKRIIVDRFVDPEHPYKPSVAPCVVQFAFDEDRYIFQRLLEPRNGTLRRRRPGRWPRQVVRGERRLQGTPQPIQRHQGGPRLHQRPGGQALPRDPPVGEDLPHLSRREGSSGPAGGSFD